MERWENGIFLPMRSYIQGVIYKTVFFQTYLLGFGGTALQEPDRPHLPRAVTVSRRIFFGKTTKKTQKLDTPLCRNSTKKRLFRSSIFTHFLRTWKMTTIMPISSVFAPAQNPEGTFGKKQSYLIRGVSPQTPLNFFIGLWLVSHHHVFVFWVFLHSLSKNIFVFCIHFQKKNFWLQLLPVDIYSWEE